MRRASRKPCDSGSLKTVCFFGGQKQKDDANWVVAVLGLIDSVVLLRVLDLILHPVALAIDDHGLGVVQQSIQHR